MLPSTELSVPKKLTATPARDATAHRLDSAAMNGTVHKPTCADIGLTRPQRAVKRLFDVVLALVFMLAFSWLMLILAIGVAATTGRPVIFGHVRVGRGGREFRCLKFRSMVPDAHQVLTDLLANDPAALTEWKKDFKLKNDPRITRFGRFLRRTSLDELPQLWNVLRGDMSLVGPRPVIQEELLHHYLSAYAHYISMRPGMSGLWQVSGRNDMSYARRVELDRSYVEHWSLWMDLRILTMTASAMVGRQGAY